MRFDVALRELKLAGAGARTFSGYGAVFGNLDSHGDVIAKGAFRDTLAAHTAAGTMPAMLAQHGDIFGGPGNMPIGVWTAMAEDEKGLKVEGYLSDTPRGQEAYTLLKDKALSGLSIGYEAKASTPGTRAGEPRRTLTAVDLWEVSLVTFPSNDLARVDGVKDGARKTARDAEKALTDAGFPARLAKAIVANGWHGASKLPAEADATATAVDAIKAQTAALSKLIERI
jgi:HK97 family phage prohead protease